MSRSKKWEHLGMSDDEADAGIWGAVIYLDLPRHSKGWVRWAQDLGGNQLTQSVQYFNYYLLHMLSTLYYRIVMYLDLPYDMYLNENYFPNQNFDYEGQALFQYTVYDMYEFQINQKTNKTKLN